MSYNLDTSAILVDTAMGEDSAVIEPHTVMFTTVTEDGVDLLLTTGAAISIPCNRVLAKRIVTMVADVKGAQKVDRDRLEDGEVQTAYRTKDETLVKEQEPKPPGMHRIWKEIMYEAETEGKIPAIKLHREIFGSGLADAKNAVEEEAAHRGVEFA